MCRKHVSSHCLATVWPITFHRSSGGEGTDSEMSLGFVFTTSTRQRRIIDWHFNLSTIITLRTAMATNSYQPIFVDRLIRWLFTVHVAPSAKPRFRRLHLHLHTRYIRSIESDAGLASPMTLLTNVRWSTRMSRLFDQSSTVCVRYHANASMVQLSVPLLWDKGARAARCNMTWTHALNKTHTVQIDFATVATCSDMACTRACIHVIARPEARQIDKSFQDDFTPSSAPLCGSEHKHSG